MIQWDISEPFFSFSHTVQDAWFRRLCLGWQEFFSWHISGRKTKLFGNSEIQVPDSQHSQHPGQATRVRVRLGAFPMPNTAFSSGLSVSLSIFFLFLVTDQKIYPEDRLTELVLEPFSLSQLGPPPSLSLLPTEAGPFSPSASLSVNYTFPSLSKSCSELDKLDIPTLQNSES